MKVLYASALGLFALATLAFFGWFIGYPLYHLLRRSPLFDWLEYQTGIYITSLVAMLCAFAAQVIGTILKIGGM